MEYRSPCYMENDCSCGYATRGGAKEVGLATTKAVVWSFLAIAMWDFVFASIFYL